MIPDRDFGGYRHVDIGLIFGMLGRMPYHRWARTIALARMAGTLGNVSGSGGVRRACPHCKRSVKVTKAHRCTAKRKRTGRRASFRQIRYGRYSTADSLARRRARLTRVRYG